MDISQDIRTNGYILLKNKLNEKELNFGLSSIEGKKVNYVITKQFKKIKKNKYRFFIKIKKS